MLKRQSCGDGRGRERERERYGEEERRAEETRGKGRGWTTARTAAVTHFAQCFYAAFCTTFEERPTPTIDSFRWQANASFHTNHRHKDTLRFCKELDRRPDGFLINVCKFLARSKIFLPHSCNNFHTCSIFVPRPKQIYIQQIFANICKYSIEARAVWDER